MWPKAANFNLFSSYRFERQEIRLSKWDFNLVEQGRVKDGKWERGASGISHFVIVACLLC